MSEESPNSLKPPKVSTEKMKKWPLYVTFLAVLSLFGVLFYSVNYGTGSRKEAEKSRWRSRRKNRWPRWRATGCRCSHLPTPPRR